MNSADTSARDSSRELFFDFFDFFEEEDDDEEDEVDDDVERPRFRGAWTVDVLPVVIAAAVELEAAEVAIAFSLAASCFCESFTDESHSPRPRFVLFPASSTLGGVLDMATVSQAPTTYSTSRRSIELRATA